MDKEQMNKNLETKDNYYQEAMQRLRFYRSEYRWITDGNTKSSKIKEINDEARKIRAMISDEQSREQLYFRKYYNSLIRKKELVERGEYTSFLRNNMLALFADISQSQIDAKDYTLLSMIKGALSGDKTLLEDYRTNSMLARVRRWIGLPKEEDLSLRTPEEILKDIEAHCNLVGIQIPVQEVAENLLPTLGKGYLTKAQEDLIEEFEKFIESGGVLNTLEGGKERQDPSTTVVSEISAIRNVHPSKEEIRHTKKEKTVNPSAPGDGGEINT